MRFDLKKPCPQCPFTRSAGSYLSEDRAREIAEAVLYGNLTFACHKFITGSYKSGSDDCEEDVSEYCPGGADQHCAGAIAFFNKVAKSDSRASNAMLQISERLGIRKADTVRPDTEQSVYDDADQMARAHRDIVSRQRHLRKNESNLQR